MEKLIEKIKHILLEEIKLHKKVLDITYKKREAILTHSVTELEEYQKTELEYLDKIKKLELTRFEEIGRIKKLQGIGADDVFTIEDLINVVPEEGRHEMEKIRRKLISLVDNISQYNKRNNFLLKKAVDFINEKLAYITKNIRPKDKYSRKLVKQVNYTKGNFLNSRI